MASDKVVFVMDDASKFSACCHTNSTTEKNALYIVNANECLYIHDSKVCEQMLSKDNEAMPNGQIKSGTPFKSR